jgi:hypothetical protein
VTIGNQGDNGMDHLPADIPTPRRPSRPGLVLAAGTRRFPIVELANDSCLIAAQDSATLRGYADIYDGDMHIAKCLIVVAAPEGDLLRCAFKQRAPFRLVPPLDYAS